MLIFCRFTISALLCVSMIKASGSNGQIVVGYQRNPYDLQHVVIDRTRLLEQIVAVRKQMVDFARLGQWEKIHELSEISPFLFEQVVIVDKKPFLFLSMLQHLRNVDSSCMQSLSDTLTITLNKLSAEDLNCLDEKGQSIAHKMTPFNWLLDVIKVMHSKGVRFDMQTSKQDKYPGSTLAHNVAGMFRFPRSAEATARSHDFFLWMFSEYPHVVGLVSMEKTSRRKITCWSLLQADTKRFLMKNLKPDQKQAIVIALQNLKNQEKLTLFDYDKIIQEMYYFSK